MKKRKIIRIILNIVGIIFYIVSFVGFFLKWIYAWIEGVGTVGQYYGWQLALNFDGMPQNLGTLVPMLSIIIGLIYGIVVLIIKLKNLNKEPKEPKGGVFKVMLLGLLYLMMGGIVTMFLCLSTHNILGLEKPDDVAGYFMGYGPYVTGYLAFLGGLTMFICESGLIKEKVEAPEAEEPKKEEVKKPTPQQAKAPQVKKVQPQPQKPAPQPAKPKVDQPVKK